MSDTDQQLVKMERAAAELRTLIRQAHEAAQELSDVLKSARTLVDQYAAHEVERVMNLHVATTQSMVDQWTADASADIQGFIDRLIAAVGGVVTLIEMRMETDPVSHAQVTADVVIDLRTEQPHLWAGDDPEALRVLRDAPYKVIVGPANRRVADRA